MANVISADGSFADSRHYLHNGFSASITESYKSPSTYAWGITWDGTNVISADGNSGKHYLHVGFSNSISESYASPSGSPSGITWDSTNVISADDQTDKHYLHTGFSDIIDGSYTAPEVWPNGITWDGTNVISVAYFAKKHFKHIGFSASIGASYTSPSTYPSGITWDNINVISADFYADRHYRHNGFSASISSSYASPSTYPTGITWDERYDVAGDNMLSADYDANRHYAFAGFSNSITDSYTSPSTRPTGIAWDGTDTLSADKLSCRHYKHYGFSISIRESYASPSGQPAGIAWDGTDTLSADAGVDKIYKHEGFSAAITASFSGPYYATKGVTWDGTHVLSTDSIQNKHYKHNGFSSAILDSYAGPSTDPEGISWDGTDVISSDSYSDKHYKHDGFSSSILDSYNSPATHPTGIDFGFTTSELTITLEGALTFTGELLIVKEVYKITLEGSLSLEGDVGYTHPWNPGKPWGPDDPEFDPDDPDKPQYPGGVQWHKLLTGSISPTGLLGRTEAFTPPDPPSSTVFQIALEGTMWADGVADGVGIIGTRRDDDPPDPPHPPETGITFHRSRTGRITFVGDLNTEQKWPRGLFDKGTIEDSMTLIDTVTSGGPSGKVSTSRNHPHRGKYYLAVHNPTKLYWGEVDSVTPDVGGTEVTFINADGTRLRCLKGMTVKVYNSAGDYKGKTRIRDGPTFDTLTVAEQDDLDWTVGDLFEIYEVMELWAKFPRVIVDPGDPEALIWYRDWDLTPVDMQYPMQLAKTRCIPIIGSPTCAFLDGPTASIYFTAKESYNINPAIPPAWWQWAFRDGTPFASNDETPGYITWDTPGVYLVSCSVEKGIPSWPQQPTYRFIHIFERTGANAPYTNFNILNLSGSVSEGGWSAEFEVYTDVEIADFPEGAQVILFAEEELGGFDFGSEEPPEYRSKVKYVGYIVGGSVTKDPETRVTRFRTSGIQTLMKNRDNFSLALDYADVATADDWTKQDVLTPNYAFINLILWNSTLMGITDVFLPAYYYELWQSISHKASDYLVKYQDFGRGTLWRQIDSLAKDVFARIIVDRFGRVSICNNPQHTIEADLWADLPVPYTFGPLDWEAPLLIEFVDEPVVSVVCVEGVAFDGATATPVIGYHPGELPTYRGRIQTQSGCVLSSQNEAEFLAQGLFSIQNNTYPRVVLKCLGNYSFVDLADLGGIQISLDAADTRYGIAWANKRFFVEAVTHSIDFQTGLLTTELHLVAFAYLHRPCIGA